MDYLKFFELQEEPFRNDGDPRFFFQTRAQARARVRLMRGIQQHKGLMLVSGGAGCGKTTLARHLLETLDGPRCTARMLSIPHAACDSGWVLPRIAATFGVSQVAAEPVQVLGQIFERLAVISADGKLPVLLVDEAQLLRNPRVMEEFRGLLNMEHDEHRLLSMVLFGLPELMDVLRLDAPLAQRVDVGVRLDALEPDEVAEYVRHRLDKVGGAPDLFTDEAIDALGRLCEGIPRLVNTLADNSLFESSLSEARPVDASTVSAAAEQLGLLDSPAEPDADAESTPAAAPSNLAASFGARVPSAKGKVASPPLAEPEETGRADWVAPLAPEPEEEFAAEEPETVEALERAAPEAVGAADIDLEIQEEEELEVEAPEPPVEVEAEQEEDSEIDDLLDNLLDPDDTPETDSEPVEVAFQDESEPETLDSLFDEIKIGD
jgi:type II secretory pathway predicted ATPase ExeA